MDGSHVHPNLGITGHSYHVDPGSFIYTEIQGLASHGINCPSALFVHINYKVKKTKNEEICQGG